jgi:hypothetical protein
MIRCPSCQRVLDAADYKYWPETCLGCAAPLPRDIQVKLIPPDPEIRCPICNDAVGQSLETVPPTCPRCGGSLQSKPVYQGVHGWLLYLCVCLTVLAPLLFLVYFARWVVLEHFYIIPGQVILEICALGSLTVFSVFAGVSLWSVRPTAVKIAKAYFIVSFLLIVVLATARQLPFTSPVAALAAIAVIGIQAIPVLVGCGLWYLYLTKSERVKATFGGLNEADIVSLSLGSPRPRSGPEVSALANTKLTPGRYTCTDGSGSFVDLRSDGEFFVETLTIRLAGRYKVVGEFLFLRLSNGHRSKATILRNCFTDTDRKTWCREGTAGC